MREWTHQLLDTSDFPARWFCGNWSEAFGWSYITADVLIALAYFAIPGSIFFFYLRRRDEIHFPKLYWLFAAFILSCGIGHLVNASLFWIPWYRLSGLVNGVTALVSWVTVFALIRYLPEAIKLPGALRLTRQLELQIAVQSKVEAELRESESRFRTLAEHLPLIMFTAGSGGRIDFLNAAFFSFTGADPRGFRFESALDYFHEEDRAILEKRWKDPNSWKSHFEGEVRLRSRTGDYRLFLVRIVVLSGQTPRSVGFGIDITQQKKDTDDQLRLERQILEGQKLESLGILAGGIAHDFNNLLTGILGSASLAQMDVSPAHPIMTHLKQIETSSVRAADLCRQMLAYSGKGRFVVGPIQINKLIEETTHLIQSSINKKVVIRYDLAESLPTCEGDATQLRQVIMNLVINASDAIGDRSGYISVNTGLVRADPDYLAKTYGAHDLAPGDYLYLEVNDSGCGMTPETVSKIFDPFFTTKFSGRGLGLAAVLGIIKGHKGAIRVYSEPGKGTTFKILLPVSHGEVLEQPALVPLETRWKSQGTVLIVDDEETIRTVTSRILESWGFRCLLAADGKEGVEVFQTNHASIRLVLMDLTMPHLDGEQAFREMRRIQPQVQVILMSGFNEQEAINRFLGKGLAGFVQKPFYPRQLETVMRSLLQE